MGWKYRAVYFLETFCTIMAIFAVVVGTIALVAWVANYHNPLLTIAVALTSIAVAIAALLTAAD